jgi:hypothetical protein
MRLDGSMHAAVIGRLAHHSTNFSLGSARPGFERIVEFEVCVEHRIGFVAAELLEAGRVNVAVHAGAERAALDAVAAQQLGVEAGAGSAGLDDLGDRPGIDCYGADAGQGVLPPSRPRGGIQIRRKTAPAVITAASCQDRKARIGHSSVVP